MSQVKNLRAMFEQKQDLSPPDRGRSPGGQASSKPCSPLLHLRHILAPTIQEITRTLLEVPQLIVDLLAGTDSPRPLSSIRTSFVAVEKDGRIGLQRSESGGSIGSRRKFSNGTEGETPPVLNDKTNLSSFRGDLGLEPRKNLAYEPIPESPRQDTSGKMAPELETTPVRTSQTEKKANGTGTAAAPGSGTPKSKVTTNGNASLAQTDGAGAGDQLRRTNTELKKANGSTEKPAIAAASTKPPAKVAPISTTSKTTSKPAKSPATVKTPPGLSKPASSTTARTSAREAVQTTRRAEPTETAAQPVSTTAKSVKPVPSNSLDRGVGFVKPRPKSPTRPVQLPAGLMTHTASSVSKVNAPGRQSLSRASGSYSNIGRSPSRASVSAANAGNGAAKRDLKRQSSVINRPRPSFGPPPKQAAKDFPQTNQEKDVNQDFLARMMRPTQSSSSKTHEKLPSTPPRKISNPPAAKKPIVRHQSSTRSETVDRSSSPIQPPENVSETEMAPPSTAQVVAPVVEQAVTAEEAIEIAKEAEGEVELPAEEPAPAQASLFEEAKDKDLEVEPTAAHVEHEVSAPEKHEVTPPSHGPAPAKPEEPSMEVATTQEDTLQNTTASDDGEAHQQEAEKVASTEETVLEGETGPGSQLAHGDDAAADAPKSH
jgi:hypothetical protein